MGAFRVQQSRGEEADMKRTAPRLNRAALRAAVAAIESPVLGEATFSVMAGQMGIISLLRQDLPDEALTDLSPNPRATRKERQQ
jgi:hypothetical protein